MGVRFFSVFAVAWLALLATTLSAWAADTFPGTTLSGTSGTVASTTVGMTGEAGEPNFIGGATTSDWYSWTATANGYFTIGTCNLTSETTTATDTTLAAYTGVAVNALTAVQTNDDSNACNSTVNANYGSTLGFNVTSGTTYRFQVDTYQNSAQNTFVLRWGLAALTVDVTDASATEGGDMATFTVVPTSPPPGTTAGTNSIVVTIGASTQCTFAPTTLTFTKANWTTPQTVTVTATNDGIAEGTHSCSPASITTTNYGGVTGTPPIITIYDNDNPSFTIAKSANIASIGAPGTITYTITVDNNGSAVLTATSISDALTLNGNATPLTTGPTLTSGDTNSNSILEDTETWVYTATYAVTQGDIDTGGTFSNTATFDTSETSAQTSAAATTTITQSPALQLVKSYVITTDSGMPGEADPGDIVTYYYDVTNTGNVTISNVSVADVHSGSGSPPVPLPGNVASLAPAAVTQFTATYQVTQTDIDNQ